MSVTIQILTLLGPLQAESDDFIMSVPVQSLTLILYVRYSAQADFIMSVTIQSLTLLCLLQFRV